MKKNLHKDYYEQGISWCTYLILSFSGSWIISNIIHQNQIENPKFWCKSRKWKKSEKKCNLFASLSTCCEFVKCCTPIFLGCFHDQATKCGASLNNQSINQSVNQLINQSTNYSIIQLFNQLNNQSINQLFNQSINYSINQSIIQ